MEEGSMTMESGFIFEDSQHDDSDFVLVKQSGATAHKENNKLSATTKEYESYIKEGKIFKPSPKLDIRDKITPGIYRVLVERNGSPYFQEVDVKTDSLLILPDTRSSQLIKEVENFWALKNEFKNGNEKVFGGYLHRRGYLLYGPPGSGKSCTIKLLMKDIISRGGIVILGQTPTEWMITGITALREVEPDKPIIIVLEDIDALVQGRESEYLSLLDGEDTQDNILFLATTNYPERLDSRIYNRPRRFNDAVWIGPPNLEGRKAFLDTKIKDKSLIPEIAELTNGFTLDHLKALILSVFFEKKDLKEEVKRLKNLFKIPKDPQKPQSLGLMKESE